MIFLNEDRKNSYSTTSIAHTTHISTSFAAITHSNPLGLWVIDPGATYHIIGNKKISLLYLPFVIYLLLL